ncbi:MAG: TonB-dependent receptor [Steroidobacteraceae bacterium]
MQFQSKALLTAGRAIAAAAVVVAFPLSRSLAQGEITSVLVTAARYAEDTESALAPALVISRATLDRSVAIDVTEVLRFHAGLDVVRSGGPGQSTSVFIRGAESNHTLVLIDGVRVNPGTIGTAALQNIAPELIERIEVVKGPRSTLYGSDAIGGVINLITRRDQKPGGHFSAQAGMGTYATRQGNAQASFAGDQGSAGVAVSWLNSDGFPTRIGSTTNRGFDNLSVSANARTQIGDVDAAVRYWQASGSSEYSDFFLTPVDQDFRDSVGALELGYSPAGRWHTKALFSRIEDRSQQNQSPDRLRTERYALDWQNDIEVSDADRIVAGVMYSTENADAMSFGTGFNVDTDITTAYLQNTFTSGRHELVLAAGYTDHTTFGNHTTWNAEYGLGLGDSTRVIASAGTAFRAPDATDRFGFGGNPALKPEESTQFEFSLQQRLSERQTLRLNAFQNDIDELIEYVITDFSTFDGELRNTDQARIRGIELTWALQGTDWQVRAEASHQQPKNRATGEALLRRAKNSVALGYVQSFGHLELGVDVLGVGERIDFGPAQLDPYALANVTARYQVTADWSVLARVENVFDKQYELASGYNTPDRGVFVALRFAPK